MKRLVTIGLSAFMVAIAIAPVVKAEPVATAPLSDSTHVTTQLTPFNLVFLAYRRYFKEQGIPGYGTLLLNYQTGQITSANIIDAAIQTGRLPASISSDRSYINAVEQNLDFLAHTSN